MQHLEQDGLTLIVAGRLRVGPGHVSSSPSDEWVRGEVWIAGDTVVAVHEGTRQAPDGIARIDVGDSFVLPGVVDAHVHSLSHAGEGISASTAAAAAGGVTTIVEMPFDGAGPINSRDRLLAKQELAHDEAFVDVALLGTLAPGGGWRQADVLADNGAVGFKVSLFLTDENRFPRISDRELIAVMAAVHGVGSTLCVHAENNEIIKALLVEERESGRRDVQAHTRSRPPVSETLGVLTALEVAATTGASLHLCHLSLPRSVDLVGWYKSQGVDVTLETCPHYLTFTSADLDEQQGRLKINPPLRGQADREGLWDRFVTGDIDLVTSDHAPWPTELKDHEYVLDNASGAPGVETLAAGVLGQALRRDPSLELFGRAVDTLTIAPARRYGFDGSKGSLEVGKHADVMVFTPDESAVVDVAALHSHAGWSPYAGRALGGYVSHTISRGRVVWTVDGGLVGSAGQGELVSRA